MNRKKHGERYTELQKDTITYEFLSSGRNLHRFKTKNMNTPKQSTINRHILSKTRNIQEGVLDVKGLKNYLLENGYPLTVFLAEDGTKVQQQKQYDYRSDCLKGCVAPMDSDGFAKKDYFKATSAYKMKEHILSAPLADTAYVQLAVPLAPGAAPFVLYYFGTDNTFHADNVRQRWRKTIRLLAKEGITVLGFASDGDPKLLKAMMLETSFLSPMMNSKFGPFFIIDCRTLLVYIQDIIHLINKIRNKFFNCNTLKIGTTQITKEHLEYILTHSTKDKHGLTEYDLNPKDKMRFTSTERMIQTKVRECLAENVEHSEGTILLLQIMKQIYDSFYDVKLSPLEKVYNIWHALFIVRCWRMMCLETKSVGTDCITLNAYTSLELNAHGLVLLIEACRDSPDLFMTKCFTSQSAEDLFRELRSMTGTNQTAVEFTMKEIGERLRRAFMKVRIAYKQKHVYEFPNVTDKIKKHSLATPTLPTNDEISNMIEQARMQASADLAKMGVPVERQTFKDTLNHDLDFEFVNTGTHSDPEDRSDETMPMMEQNDATAEEAEAELVYDAEKLFEIFSGKLNLKSTSTNPKHTFRIKDSTGKIHTIKKTTFLNMFTPGRVRQTATRIIRYRTHKETSQSSKQKGLHVSSPRRTVLRCSNNSDTDRKLDRKQARRRISRTQPLPDRLSTVVRKSTKRSRLSLSAGEGKSSDSIKLERRGYSKRAKISEQENPPQDNLLFDFNDNILNNSPCEKQLPLAPYFDDDIELELASAYGEDFCLVSLSAKQPVD